MTDVDDLIKRLLAPIQAGSVAEGEQILMQQRKEAADALQRMKEALKPFVNALERLEASCSSEALYLIEDHYEIADGIIWGDLRSARAALSSREG